MADEILVADDWSAGDRLIFPDYLVNDPARSAGAFNTKVDVATSSEGRFSWRENSLREIDLTSILMGEEEKDDFVALARCLKGPREVMLFMDPLNFELNEQAIGVGDGVETAYQLYYDKEFKGELFPQVITAPDQLYPQIAWHNGVVWRETARIHVSLDSVELDADAFAVNKNTGLIVFDAAPGAGVVITVTGRFYTVVRFSDDETPVTVRGGGVFEIGDLQLIEPEGGE